MSKTPRTDVAAYEEALTALEVVGVGFARRLESDLTDCLATLESVRDYLREGTCGCITGDGVHFGCARCRMLDDVETTIKNTKP